MLCENGAVGFLDYGGTDEYCVEWLLADGVFCLDGGFEALQLASVVISLDGDVQEV